MARFSNLALTILAFTVTVGFTILALYGWFRASYLSLPLPVLASLLSVIVPFANHLGLRTYLDGRRNGTTSLPAEILGLIAIIDTILITLASAQLPSTTRNCELDARWRSMFQHKDSKNIRRIQDSLDCCGFRSIRDKAWPFPDGKGHDEKACAVRFARTRSCYAGWQREEKMLLAFMIIIGVCSLLSKILLLFIVRFSGDQSRLGHYFQQRDHGERRRLIDRTEFRNAAETGEANAQRRSYNTEAGGAEDQLREGRVWETQSD